MTKNQLMMAVSALMTSLLIFAGLSFVFKTTSISSPSKASWSTPSSTAFPASSTTFPEARDTPTTETNLSTISTPFHEVLDYAQKNLNHTGKLKSKSDGYVYLKVDDAYIYKLFPMLELKKEGFREVDNSRSKESPGAHISVFYSDEHVKPQEIGEIFHFDLKQIKVVKTTKNTSFVVLEVDSPELENLRKKYFHSAKLHGHEFHISLGKKIVRWNYKNH